MPLGERLQRSRPRGRSHLGIARIGPRVTDVVRDRRVQDARLLIDDGDGATEVVEAQGADVASVETHDPTIASTSPAPAENDTFSIAGAPRPNDSVTSSNVRTPGPSPIRCASAD